MEEYLASNIRIERPIYEQDQVRKDFQYEADGEKCSAFDCDENLTLKKGLLRFIPSISWLSHYRWKTDILSDLTSGFTVAVMHIPQGMAYALLGNVPPVMGIYMAFFPVLVYFFLGTSRHNSMGTFAVVCLMTGKAVLEHSDPSYFARSMDINATDSNFDAPAIKLVQPGYSPVQVATAVTFVVAIVQLAMFSLRLGAVSALLSETLVNGFTTGAAVHVLVSQIKDLLGLRIPKHKGYFTVINNLISIFNEIGNYNVAALLISVITITVASINNEVLKPIVAKKSSFPVPIELIAVVVGTLVSKYGNLPESYNVTTVGHIPSGLPEPAIPQFSLMPSIIMDGFTIAVVSYTITLSMALIFAQKLDYEVDPNQELLAMGSGNLVGSFFSCMPVTASLSRSLIQQTVGGKTQIASIVSCSILLCILLWIGPFFEPLPKSVLASVIVVALKGMLIQATALLNFWRLSKMDAIVWLITFLTVIGIGIDVGLLAGVIASLISILLLTFKPYTCLLGHISRTDLYLDTSKYKAAEQIPGIKIFQYSGGINFATRGIFKNELIRRVEINPQKEIIYRTKLAKYAKCLEADDRSKPNLDKIERVQKKVNTDIRCIILDFSSLSYIDPSGVTMLKNVVESYKKLDIPIYVAATSDPVYEMMEKCNLINTKTALIRSFPTVHDAVQSATDIFNINLNSNISIVSRI
ncbi:prestin-like isoform X2 [Aethina tumida]|nr:prestin-like isoform X2 [Aethina tumida]XP_049820982.1 prestin-like isoform X2 [Aethina tumida]